MPIVYAAGTADASGYYSGINCATDSDLLTAIRNNLSAAGWTITSDQIASNRLFVARGVDNSHNCWVEFSTVVISGFNFNLRIRGDRTGAGGTGTHLSPFLTAPFNADGLARLYLAADEAGGCLCVVNNNGTGQGMHFGFPNRLNTSNQFGWLVGYLDCWLNNVYVARSRALAEWRHFRLFFNSSTESQTAPHGCYQFLIDSLTIAPFFGNSSSQWSNTSTGNCARNAPKGGLDPETNRALLGRYGYVEGTTIATNYPIISTELGIPLPYLGDIRFAKTGMASLSLGIQCRQVGGTATFLSAGGVEFQGFQIAP